MLSTVTLVSWLEWSSSVAAIECLNGPGWRRKGEEAVEGRVGRKEGNGGEAVPPVRPSVSTPFRKSQVAKMNE